MQKHLQGQSGKTGIWIVSAVLLFLAVLFWGIPIYSEYRLLSKMDPDLRAQFEHWYSTRVSVAPEDLRVQPFSAETRETVRQIEIQISANDEILNTFKKEVPADVRNITDEIIEANRQRLEAAQPLLNNFAKVVRQPDYTWEVWFNSSYPPTGGYVLARNPKVLLSVMKGVCLNAMTELKDGRIEEAIKDAETLVKFVHFEPLSMLSARGDIFTLRPLFNLKQISRKAYPLLQDPTRKQMFLELLEQQKDKFNIAPPAGVDLFSLDSIGMTSQARHAGLEPDFQGKTGPEVYIESIRIQSEYIGKYVLPSATDTEDRQEIQKDSEDYAALYNAIIKSQKKNRTGWRRLHTQRHDRILAVSFFAASCIDEQKVSERIQGILNEYDDFLAELKAMSGDQGTTPVLP